MEVRCVGLEGGVVEVCEGEDVAAREEVGGEG